MDAILKRIFQREFQVNPDSGEFIDLTDYLQNPPQDSLKTTKNIEYFMKEFMGRCFDFPVKAYDVFDRDNELVGYISTRESLAPVIYKKGIVGGVYQIEVYNQFSQAVSSRDFLSDPEGWHKRLQVSFAFMSGSSYNGDELYWGFFGGFLEEDVLLDVAKRCVPEELIQK